MKNTILLITSMLACLLGNVGRKYYTQRNRTGVYGNFIYNSICSLIAAIVLICIDGWSGVGLYTCLLGILFGVITAAQGIFNLFALEIGPFSYTTVIVSCSTLISALSGYFFFEESLGVCQMIGIAMMVVCFFFSVEKKDNEKKANMRWLLFSAITFFATGFIGILQKIHQSSSHKDELIGFLVIAFVTSAALCALVAAILAKKEFAQKKVPCKHTIWLVLVMVFVGICSALNNKFNLYLSGVMDSAVFFPIVNGGGLVLTTMAALIIFREKLTVRQWIGIGFGIASVILLCTPFG